MGQVETTTEKSIKRYSQIERKRIIQKWRQLVWEEERHRELYKIDGESNRDREIIYFELEREVSREEEIQVE